VEDRAWLFLTLEGLDEPPPGDAILVSPGRRGALETLRRPAAPVMETATVAAVDG
jgi:hypothetical protein